MISKEVFKKMLDDERQQAANLGLRGIIVHARDGKEIPMVIQGTHDRAQEFAERMDHKYVSGIDRETIDLMDVFLKSAKNQKKLFYELEQAHRNGC